MFGKEWQLFRRSARAPSVSQSMSQVREERSILIIDSFGLEPGRLASLGRVDCVDATWSGRVGRERSSCGWAAAILISSSHSQCVA